jgi:hypothetical protein
MLIKNCANENNSHSIIGMIFRRYILLWNGWITRYGQKYPWQYLVSDGRHQAGRRKWLHRMRFTWAVFWIPGRNDAFLKTPTGDQPAFKMPILPPSSDKTPRPQPFSK